MRALIVEDDNGVAQFVERGLQENGFAVDLALDGETGVRQALTETYDIIVLDLMLPKRDGLSVLRELRQRGYATPVILLTARDGVDDRVTGLNSGADDSLVKPFSFAELLALIRATMRRGVALVDNPVHIADLSIDIRTRIVLRDGHRIELSVREFALLEYLVRHADEVVSRTMLLDHVWNMNHDPKTNVVDVHINRLRKKIDQGFHSTLIHTVRGVGYVLRRPPAEEART